MSRSQEYLDSLLSGVPLEELASFESRAAFQHVTERLTGTEDVAGELKVLYRVNNFSELALQLLWIAQRTEQDPSMLEPTAEEQTLVLSLFRNAVGDTAEVIEEQPETLPMDSVESVAEPEAPAMEMSEQVAEPEPVVESEPMPEPVAEPETEPVPEPEPMPEASTGFGQVEETPQEETPTADAFGMSTPEPATEQAQEGDPFGMGATMEEPPAAPVETAAEAPVESSDPFGMGGGTEESTGFGSTEEQAAPPMDFPTDSTTEQPAEPAADFPAAPESSQEALGDFPSGEPETPAAAQPAASADEGSPEMQFARLVERFAEAISSGAEDRDAVKDEMLNACAAAQADGGAADDYKNFCQVLTEFITYIYENQFVDDIRVMNLVSNVPDPVLAWAKADGGSRAGMMDAAYDTLRDFKSLFE